MAGEDELLSMGSKLEVELDCPGGPNKVYWGRRSGRLRTRNWGYTQHIDAVWSMKCFKELIKLDVFPDAKDISESMGALRAATLYSHLSLRKDAEKSRRDALRSRWKEENVWCICIGDGSTPRTATLISFLTVWNLFSIDPGLKKEFVGKEPKGIQRLEAFDLKFEDWAKMYSKSADCQRIKSMCKYLFIICVHSHHRFVGEASFDKIRDAFGNCPTCLTEGKGAQLKMDLVEKIRDSVDNYKFLYVFSYENMRTNMFKQVRKELKNSRLFLGKNKVMQIALGRTEAEEYGDELMEISKQLSGNKGLLFSDKNVKAMQKIFNSSTQKDFARAGNLATETVEFEEGPLPSMPHNMDEPLRQLGMPVMLKRGENLHVK
eukprot:g12920.t1